MVAIIRHIPDIDALFARHAALACVFVILSLPCLIHDLTSALECFIESRCQSSILCVVLNSAADRPDILFISHNVVVVSHISSPTNILTCCALTGLVHRFEFIRCPPFYLFFLVRAAPVRCWQRYFCPSVQQRTGRSYAFAIS